MSCIIEGRAVYVSIGGMEPRYFASPWSSGGRDTDGEQNFPGEKRANSACSLALHHETQCVRDIVFNWLLSSHTLFALNLRTSAVGVMTLVVQMG